MTTYIAATGDWHAGSTLGLCDGQPVPLDDGGAYLRTKAQEWTHGHFLTYWKAVAKLRKKRGDRLVVILNGDLVDGGAHHGTTQCISNDLAIQSLVLHRLAEPMIRLSPDAVVVVRGTEVHVGKAGGAEEQFARWLSAKCSVVKDHERETWSHWHFTGSFGRVRVDATHHGRVGARPWTRVNAVAALGVELLAEYAHRGELPPQLAIRSHCHQYADSGPSTAVRVLALPAFQIKTAYGYRTFPNSLADIGAATIACEDGKFEVTPHLYYPTRDSLWRGVA